MRPQASFFRVLTLLPLFAILAACGDSGTEPDPTVSGLWQGTSQGTTVTLTLSESDGEVDGSGSMSDATSSFTISVVNSTLAYPSLSLLLFINGYGNVNFTGTIASENTMTATLNGAGFVNWGVTLTR